MSKHKTNLSWGDRFALIDFYKPSDDQVCAAFGVTRDELDTARTLRAAGTFVATKNMDVQKYTSVFSVPTQLTNQPKGIVMTPSKTPTATSHAPADVSTKPETASKPIKVPKKRGRKGDKILKALTSVPKTQMPVDQFIQQHDVSLAVLRQAKRFVASLDPTQAQQIGRINVRQDKTTKKLMIWREDI